MSLSSRLSTLSSCDNFSTQLFSLKSSSSLGCGAGGSAPLSSDGLGASSSSAVTHVAACTSSGSSRLCWPSPSSTCSWSPLSFFFFFLFFTRISVHTLSSLVSLIRSGRVRRCWLSDLSSACPVWDRPSMCETSVGLSVSVADASPPFCVLCLGLVCSLCGSQTVASLRLHSSSSLASCWNRISFFPRVTRLFVFGVSVRAGKFLSLLTCSWFLSFSTRTLQDNSPPSELSVSEDSSVTLNLDDLAGILCNIFHCLPSSSLAFLILCCFDWLSQVCRLFAFGGATKRFFSCKMTHRLQASSQTKSATRCKIPCLNSLLTTTLMSSSSDSSSSSL